MDLPKLPTHEQAEAHMRELIKGGNLAEPDEVRYEFSPDEVVFIWQEQKLAVVVEIEPGPA
jgi:hypothetical protein